MRAPLRDRLVLAAALGALYLAVLAEARTGSAPAEGPPAAETPFDDLDSVTGILFLSSLALVFAPLLALVLRHVFVSVDREAPARELGLSATPHWGFVDFVFVISIYLTATFALAISAGMIAERLAFSDGWQKTLILVVELLVPVLVVAAMVGIAFLRGNSIAALGLLPARAPRLLLGAALAWFLFIPFFLLAAASVQLLRNQFDQPPENQDVVELIERMERQGAHRPLLAAIVVSAVFVAPVFEELVFRGFLFGYLRRRLPAVPAMVLSAVAFTMMHLPISVWPPIFLLGLFLAWIYERTGSLVASIGVHFCHNAAVMVLIVWPILFRSG